MPISDKQRTRKLREALGPDIGNKTKTYTNSDGERVYEVRCAYCWWHRPQSKNDPGKRWRFRTNDPHEAYERWHAHAEGTPHIKEKSEQVGSN